MIRDITLGQYYPGESIIHRLDPRIKIIAVLVYIITLFIETSFIGLGFFAATLLVVVIASKVPIGYILRGLKVIFIILLFTFILNMFMYDGRVLVKIWKFTITDVGLTKAFFMAARLIILIIASSLLTFTTTPIKLTDGIEYLLKPLKIFKVPAHEIALVMTIALRFIPTLLEETDKIMKAQQARGADFETGNVFRRAKSMIPIMIPLFISAFRIAQEMAIAMEARCYHGGEGRTRMHVMKFQKRDVVATILLIIFIAVAVLMRIFI